MDRNNGRFMSVTGWVITGIIILSLACSLGPISLTWDAPEPEAEMVLEPEATLVIPTEVPTQEEAALLIPTEVPTPEADPVAPTSTEPAPEASDPPLAEVHPDHQFGQIILHGIEDDAWHQNLATGELRQLTEPIEKDSPLQTNPVRTSFSDSGRYLAYWILFYQDWFTIFDLEDGKEVVRIYDQYPIGWRYGEEIFLMGENTGFCDESNPEECTPDAEVDFLISAYDPETLTSTPMSSFTGGWRPHGLGSQLNLIHLTKTFSEPGVFDVWGSWDTVISDMGEFYPGIRTWHARLDVTRDGSYYVPFGYNIHAPEEDGLWVISVDGETSVEIFREPEKFVSEALWSPDGTHILFWLRGVDFRSEQLMLIDVDGSDIQEITAYLYAREWDRDSVWYDNEHLLVSGPEGSVDLLNVDTGEVKTLITFTQPGYRIIAWWRP